MSDPGGPPAGSPGHAADLRAARGAQLGDHNVQHNEFVMFRRPWTRRRKVTVGLLVGALLCGASSREDVRRFIGGGSAAPAVSVSEALPCEQHHGWVVADPSAVAPQASWASERPVTYQRWLADHDAVPAVQQQMSVILRGYGPAAIVIDDILVTLVARRPPLSGREVVPYCEGGGPVRVLHVPVPLDALTPGEAVSLREWYASGRPGVDVSPLEQRDRVQLPFTVSDTDVAALSVVARTTTCDCDWRMTVSWINGEERGRTLLPGPDESFRLTAVSGTGP